MKTWLKKNKYLLGAIGFGMIAFFCFFFANVNHKEEVTREAKTLLSSGLEEAKKTKLQSDDQSQPIGMHLSEGERPTVQTLQEAQKNFDQVKGDILGTIRIASIGLELPILEGNSFEKMLFGACTVLPHQVMGQGNYALAAHNAGVEGLMFTSLGKVAVGETITLQDRSGHVFSYTVKEKLHVDKTDTRVLEGTEKPTVTLITCDKEIETDGRIVVIAELV